MKIGFYTTFALFCFALNSLLCRLALGAEAIDAASFTAIRLISGAIALLIISLVFGKKELQAKGDNWISAFFSFRLRHLFFGCIP